MQKSFLGAALVAMLLAQNASPALLPGKAGTLVRTKQEIPVVSTRPLWDEYGLEEADQCIYHAGIKLFQITAYRFKDPTGAFAASQWQAGTEPKAQLIQQDNYILAISGGQPTAEELKPLWAVLPKVAPGPPPNLTGYLPPAHKVSRTGRYLLGETSLGQFLPQVNAETAGFSLGAEAAMADYEVHGARFPLAVFSYPTPQIARHQVTLFEKLPGAKALRTGPFVAVTFPGAAGSEAEQTLNSVSYNAVVTLNQGVPKKQPNVGVAMISIFMLAGILIALCLIAGIGVGVMRLYPTRFGRRVAEEQITVLHLSDN